METEHLSSLSEHVEPLLFVMCFIITSLLALLGWFVKRTVGKLEDNVNDLWELARDNQNKLIALRAEHDVRHRAD